MSRRVRLRHDDEGAAAVEFALLFPIFMVLVIGMISAGFAFERWISVTQGAREAARYGATLPIKATDPSSPSTDLWLQMVSDSAIAASDLDRSAAGASPLTNAVPGTSVCAALVAPDNTDPAPVAARRVGVTTNSAGAITRTYADATCTGIATVSGDYVQVRVSRPTDFNYLIANPTLQVQGKNVSRYEAAATS
jgi:Flp pilus assembly pilin Flp